MISIKNLNLIRSNRFLLKDINLEINKGIHTVVGPNGAGKTTLLRSISGVFSDYQGSIQYFGKEIKDYSGSELAKNRAFASQFFDVAFPFTAKEIIEMGRFIHGFDHRAMLNDKITGEVINQLSISHLINQSFQTLSGGEKQRVQLARVLSQVWDVESAVLLLDEPTSALDFSHQVKLFDLINSQQKKMNWMVIMVLHDLHAASFIADNVILMANAEVVDFGDSKKVLSTDQLTHVYNTKINRNDILDDAYFKIYSK